MASFLAWREPLRDKVFFSSFSPERSLSEPDFLSSFRSSAIWELWIESSNLHTLWSLDGLFFLVKSRLSLAVKSWLSSSFALTCCYFSVLFTGADWAGVIFRSLASSLRSKSLTLACFRLRLVPTGVSLAAFLDWEVFGFWFDLEFAAGALIVWALAEAAVLFNV